MVQELYEEFYTHVQLKGQFDMGKFMSRPAETSKTKSLKPGWRLCEAMLRHSSALS